jgi:transcriptional regulator
VRGNCLAVFQGPQQYVTPSWYHTKQESGKVVPTWNYAVVHAHGQLVIHDDPLWVRELLEKLTHSHESPRKKPWHMTDAPEEFVNAQMRAIVGIEILITRLEGKWKVSQNRTTPDREGVIRGLREEASERNEAMAHLVETAMKNPK